MHFLVGCRKAEEQGKVGQAKAATKAKVAAGTVLPTKEDELTKQLKYQQHQIDALVGQVRSLVSAERATQASSIGTRPSGFGRQTQGTWRGGSRGRACLHRLNSEPLLSQMSEATNKSRGLSNHTCVGNMERWDI